jgi:hypothetical protein
VDTVEELRRHPRALGYEEVAIGPVLTGGPATAICRVDGAPAVGREPLRRQGTLLERRHRVAARRDQWGVKNMPGDG